MNMSASMAEGPRRVMLRIKARGTRMMICRLMSAMMLRGWVWLGVTASRKVKRFSAMKIMPAQTKPICESAMELRIIILSFGPPTAAPSSP